MSDELFMKRALELAQQGLGKVSPNPIVGCVIVHDGKIIGEGFHRQYSGPHAEVNAIHSVHDKSLLPESVMYVTLEPCSHYGKTPPCAELIVRHQLKKVVICNEDPNPLVSGKGIEMLRQAGIEVEMGLKEEEGKELNKRFFRAFVQKRPYIILKWAETADGFMARENYDSKWISNQYSRQLVHKWRSEEDAIMVGTNTAKYDNPSLTVRDWNGSNPVRIVIDRDLQLDPKLHLFDGAVKTLLFTEKEAKNHKNPEYIQLPGLTISGILNEIHKRDLHSLIVEGGSRLLKLFLDQNLWDEARVFVGEKSFGTGIKAPCLKATIKSETKIFSDRLTIYKNV